MIGGVDSTAYAVHTEGVGENVTQSENFAYIVAEGKAFPFAFFAHGLNCFYFIATMTENFWQE